MKSEVEAVFSAGIFQFKRHKLRMNSTFYFFGGRQELVISMNFAVRAPTPSGYTLRIRENLIISALF
jgi:hypothetical protein